MQLSLQGMKWLKTLHLFCASCWVGGVMSLMAIHCIRFLDAGTGSELYGLDRAAHAVDMAIVVTLGAMGCFFTGLAYSLVTKWGFLKHKWIIAKWCITVFCIAFGTFYLGPWEEKMGEISATLGASAIEDNAYQWARWKNLIFGFLQGCVLIITIGISVFKPWRKKEKERELP